jgi:hypothetical protein
MKPNLLTAPVILLFAGFFLLHSCSATPDEYTMNANELYIKGDIEGAIEELSKGIAIRSDDTTPKEADNPKNLEQDLLFRADMYIQTDNYEAAYQDAQDACFISRNSVASKNFLLECEQALEENQPGYFDTHERRSENL